MEYAVPKFARMACPQCKQHHLFRDGVLQSSLPVRIQCDGCGWFLNIEEGQRLDLSKEFGTQLMGDWQVYPGKQASKESFQQAPDLSQVLDKGSFQKRLDEAAVNFLAGLHLIESLRGDLAAMSDHFKLEIETVYSQGTFLREGWKPEMLTHFLLNPYTVLPCYPMDQSITDQSCYVLMPKFFQKLIGFPVSVRGGFYLQAITPYSQVAFPLETSLREQLGLKPLLDIDVEHNYLVGKSVEKHWQEMDGVGPASDYSENHCSIQVEDRVALRKWLIKHAIPIWADIPTHDDDIHPAPQRWFLEDGAELAESMLKTFRKKGRIFLAWKDIANARAFAAFMCIAYKGFKLVVHNEQMATSTWTGAFRNKQIVKEFTFSKPERFEMEEVSRNFDVMIVDLTTGIPLEFIESLHHYTGRLVLLSDDPLLDSLLENEYAATAYSLCNSVLVNPSADWIKNPWPELERKVPEQLALALARIGVEVKKSATCKAEPTNPHMGPQGQPAPK